MLRSSIIPASTAAFRIKCLCSSDQRAGTVRTHLILVLTTLPTYSDNFSNAFSAMYFKLWEMTFMRGSCLPSTLFACASM